MELKLKIHTRNRYPKRGIFIYGNTLQQWIAEIDRMGFSLEKISVFPVPGTVANQLYGALVVYDELPQPFGDIGKNSFFQQVGDKVFIPERTMLFPELTKAEFATVFSEHYHLMHPEIGLYELEEEICWKTVLALPVEKECNITEPLNSIKIPTRIHSFQIKVDEEKVLAQIENPLTEQQLIDKLPFDLKKVMKGNEREIGKLLAYLDKNPEYALQFAIPLDTLGSSRGGNGGRFIFGNRINHGLRSGLGEAFEKIKNLLLTNGISRFVFTVVFLSVLRNLNTENVGSVIGALVGISVIVFLFWFIFSGSGGEASHGGGSGLIHSDRFNQLLLKYENLAEEYIKKGEYHKASHIYLKLIKNHHRAAIILEEGKLYNDAAVIYLKYQNNIGKAAECYEKGHAYQEALALYKQLNFNEKAGDMYVKLHNSDEANNYYKLVVDQYINENRHVKAALVCKDKMNDTAEARELLLKGWGQKRDAENCMRAYFMTFDTVDGLSSEIVSVYKVHTDPFNRKVFLQVLKGEFTKDKDLEEVTRNIAYEIVAENISDNSQIASELISFNKNNKSILKDVIKFKMNKKGKK